MEWFVRLSGNSDTLEELSRVCNLPDLLVEKEKDYFVLKSRDFDILGNQNDVFKEASEFVSLINGVIKITLGSDRGISVENVIKKDDDGTITHFIVGSASSSFSFIMAKVTLVSADGTVSEISQAEPVLKWVRLARNNDNVAKVLRLLNMGNAEWPTNFNRIFEIIEGDSGRIDRKVWVSTTAIKRFGSTVNSPDAIGDIARHGKQKRGKKASPKPMDFHEAKAFIETIVYNWLNSKTQ